jgi:hypothetical protein
VWWNSSKIDPLKSISTFAAGAGAVRLVKSQSVSVGELTEARSYLVAGEL